MRLSVYAIALLLLGLSGCAQLDTRDAESAAHSAAEAQPSDALYRLESIAPAPASEPVAENTPDYGLWTRLARDFTMHTDTHERIDRELFGYQGRLDQLQRITQRAEPYLFFIVEQLRERKMPMELALLPIVESAYQPQATSRSQAAGLWQFIPSTGQYFGLKQNWWYDGRRDVHASTQAALDYLQYLNNMFEGDWALTLASYNAGEGTVSRAIERAAAKGQPTDYWSLDLPEETKAYVPRLIALARLFHDPQAYNLCPHKVEDAPFLTRIDLDRSLDLSKVANAVDMSLDDIYRFNPGFKRGVNGNGKESVALMLPQDKAAQLQGMDIEAFCVTMSRPRQVVAARGESLFSFAKRYRVDVASIRDMNPRVRDKIKRGDKLLLPPSDAASDDKDESRAITVVSSTPRADKGGYSITHDVQPGDNLFNISRKHGVEVAALASWNGIKADSTLKAGQKLTVYTENKPVKGNIVPAVVKGSPESESKKTATTPRQTVYTVQKGDTLYGIAKRFKVDIADLRAWNKMKDKEDIKPGQNIVVAMLGKGEYSPS